MDFIEQSERVSPRLALDGFGHQRGGSRRDRAALPLETDVGYLIARHLELDGEAIAAQRVVALNAGIRRREHPKVPRPSIVIENHVAVEIIDFHGIRRFPLM